VVGVDGVEGELGEDGDAVDVDEDAAAETGDGDVGVLLPHDHHSAATTMMHPPTALCRITGSS
jgi:hypothetical protein